MKLNSHPLGFVYDNYYKDGSTPKLSTSNDTQKCKFVNEIESAKRLNHANILLNHFW